MQLLAGSAVSFVFGILLTFLVRRGALANGLIATPRPDRWHQRPTALCGGIAIFLAFQLGCWLFVPNLPGTHLLLLGCALLFVLGLLDDLYHISPPVKLVIQFAVAAVVVFFGRRLPWTTYQAINIAITIFFLVGITNAVNLLDNMDGLAGGVSLIACEFLMITFLLNGQTSQAMIPALLGGAVLGFLVFNFNPASIFMGDCGSLFLGFGLGATALLSDYDRTRNLFAVLLTPVLILLIPIFDTCLVTVSRKLSGRAISQGGRDHASHRLVALGLSERRAVWLLYALAVISGTAALLVRGLSGQVIFWLLPGSGLAILFLGIYLGKVRVYEEGEQPLGNTILKTLEGFTYKRRVFEIMLDVVLVALAYYGAYLLRFDGGVDDTHISIFLYSLPLVIAAQLVLFLLGGVYRGVWRFVSFEDLVGMAKAVLGGALACAAIVIAFFGGRTTSPAVLVLYPLLLLVLLGASRYSFRLFARLVKAPTPRHPDASPILIYGAGEEGIFLLRQILHNPEHRFTPIGFLDDDFTIAGKRLCGYPIYESRELPQLISSQGIKEILVASAKVPGHKLRSLHNYGVTIKRIGIRFEADTDLVATRAIG